MAEKKEKKKKVTYVDDGRTIADMSALPDRMSWAKRGTSSPVGEIWRTYWNAVKMMFKPMLVVVGFILAVFAIVSIVFWIM